MTSDPGLQFRAVDAFVDLVEDLALRGPVVLGLDDLQWADPSTLLTVTTLARRLAYLPVALVGCYRPAPRVPQLERALDSLLALDAQRVVVGRLSDEDVTGLVAEVVGAEPGPELLREVAGAGGNPLFVTELLGAFRQEGTLRTTGGRAEVTEVTLPPTLRLTILRRLRFLPDQTLQCLRAASILGSSFTLSALSASTDQPALALSKDLADAIDAGVLADDGDRLRFRHDLIRDAIYGDLPGSVRLALHRETGRRLAVAGAPALQVAEHLARGATSSDLDAVEWMIKAAREAAASSPDIAADLLGRVVTRLPADDTGRDPLLAEQASALMRAGRVADAEAVCRSLLDRPHDPAVDGPARTCLGLALFAGGRPREGLREFDTVGEAPLLDAAGRAGGLGWASITRMWLGDLDGAAATADRAWAAALASGNHLSATIATAMFAVVAMLRGELPVADRVSADAVLGADQSPGQVGRRYPVDAPRASILLELDRLDEARTSLDNGARASESLGIRWHLPSFQMDRALERFASGDWDEALCEAEANLELAAETGEAYSTIITGGVMSLICLHRGELARAARAADTATATIERTGACYRAQWAQLARALAIEAQGRRPDALATLVESWEQCTAMGLTLEYRVIGRDLVRLALAEGDATLAAAVAAGVTRLADRNDLPSLTGAALQCRGLLADDPALLDAAVDAFAGGPRRPELALAAEDAGTTYARAGVTARARPLLEQATGIYERLGATRDLGRVESVLRAAGIRRGRRGPRSRPRFGWESLTEAEQTVAALVAEGLSNPQIGDRLFVSRRTVQTHLAHVFTKLEIGSRAQLAAEVTRRGRPMHRTP